MYQFAHDDDNYETHVLQHNAKMLDKVKKLYDLQSIHAGALVDKRANYASNRVHVTIETSVDDDNFEGLRRTEGFLECDNIVDTAALYNNVFVLGGVWGVIDKGSNKILGVL